MLQKEAFKTGQTSSPSSMDSPQRIFSQGSSIVNANVHSNHIRHLHKNAPSADEGGRFGNDRDVITVIVDGVEQVSPLSEEPGDRWVDLAIGEIRRWVYDE